MSEQTWPTHEEVAQVLDFDDFPSGVALELIAAQVAAREKAAAVKALRDAAAAYERDNLTGAIDDFAAKQYEIDASTSRLCGSVTALTSWPARGNGHLAVHRRREGDLMASLSQRRAGARNGARLSELAIREEMQRRAAEAVAREAEASARRKAARETEKARPKLTAEEVRGSRFVRDQCGWHRVVRVSAKSVTVETPYSWTERIPLDRVLDVRS